MSAQHTPGPIWFGVTKWRDEPEERQFDRVTENRLYYRERGRDRFENKWTQYKQWYPNREEAQAAIDQRKANTAERERMNRIRDAAPELLEASREALQALIGVDRLLHEHGMMTGVECPAIATLRAAIAKARGEVA